MQGNQQYINDPKIHMIILSTLDAIIKNSFFYLEPYVINKSNKFLGTSIT